VRGSVWPFPSARLCALPHPLTRGLLFLFLPRISPLCRPLPLPLPVVDYRRPLPPSLAGNSRSLSLACFCFCFSPLPRHLCFASARAKLSPLPCPASPATPLPDGRVSAAGGPPSGRHHLPPPPLTHSHTLTPKTLEFGVLKFEACGLKLMLILCN